MGARRHVRISRPTQDRVGTEMIDELSQKDSAALGVADMTGPQLRARVFSLEGAMAALLCEVRTELDMDDKPLAPDFARGSEFHRACLRQCYLHAARVLMAKHPRNS